MKRYLLLLFVFALVSGYIFYRGYFAEQSEPSKGDASIGQIAEVTLGGTVKEPENDIVSIGKLQTSYIMYTKGKIDFDNMLTENMNNLEHVLNYPFAPLPGYLFSVGYAEDSAVQFYYQSNQEETRTAILRVEYSKEGNKVTKIYDGRYLKLVAADDNNPKQLLTYDVDNEESIIEVE